jgi:lysophospholipase L1-like esterase
MLTLVGMQGPAAAAGSPPVMSGALGVYVALGDSYASGEGVTPFLPDSDRALPQNRCHRSTRAYSQLLADSPGFPPAHEFWACSGARLGNFHPGQGQWREPGQLEHLNADTELVTLSVGGNDLQFALVVGACFLTRNCQDSLGAVARMLLQHTEERLADLYREVLSRAWRAQVYVIGYPRFVVDRPTTLCQLAGLSVLEAHWLNREVTATDDALHGVVDQVADPRLHYVSTLDAFAGGEACGRTGSLVRGPVPLHPEFSFHPTAAGQAALAQRIKEAVVQTH